jgi:hypothetical protein
VIQTVYCICFTFGLTLKMKPLSLFITLETSYHFYSLNILDFLFFFFIVWNLTKFITCLIVSQFNWDTVNLARRSGKKEL